MKDDNDDDYYKDYSTMNFMQFRKACPGKEAFKGPLSQHRIVK